MITGCYIVATCPGLGYLCMELDRSLRSDHVLRASQPCFCFWKTILLQQCVDELSWEYFPLLQRRSYCDLLRMTFAVLWLQTPRRNRLLSGFPSCWELIIPVLVCRGSAWGSGFQTVLNRIQVRHTAYIAIPSPHPPEIRLMKSCMYHM